ncbi:MAG: UDP-N-acetylmuramoyl-tripeptide--D-alanyl-D-alanine ligase [Bacteroidetes bacterium]|nr:UDP-N-acetylmuramoyl-tripeptide--D-alanyl-D-alanine ligase [Bacteroidota bacterium]
MSIEEIYKIFQVHPFISTDSRKITPDSIFFALKGENFDGNTFAEKAINDGAAYAIIDNANYKSSDNIILVDNVLKTLQKLAVFHRNTLKIPIIGITGTNGKTTTKELINAVLSKKFKTSATIGNLNNHIGVPLTILSITKEHEIAIIEMGANHIGEIGELCDISKPNFGIITNIGKAHLEGFGGIDGVIETKKDLYKAVQKNNGKIFINTDNKLLLDLSNKIDKITYGNTQNEYCYGNVVKANPFVEIKYFNENVEDFIQTQLVGSYNFENILAAITVGIYFDVSKENIKDAIESYQPGNSRSQVMKTTKNTIILDAYNANPTSMEAAIRNFSEIKTDNKVLIIGDMLELGTHSQDEHKRLLEVIKEFNFPNVILVGKEFMAVCENKTCNCFIDSEDAKEWLIKNPVINAFILLKASRGIKLEKLIDTL